MRFVVAMVGVLALLGVGYLLWSDRGDPAATDGASPSLLEGSANDEAGPALASKGTARDDAAARSGADVLTEIRGLEGDALKEHLATLIPEMASVPIRYDEALARHLLTLLMHEDRIIQWRAQILLRDLRPHATDVVLPLLADAQSGWRRWGIGIVGAWAREGYRLPAAQWIALFDDADKQVATYAWNSALAGIPYDEVLVDNMLTRMRSGPRANWNGPERGIARMGPQGIERLLSHAVLPGEPFVLNVLTGLRAARPEDLRPYMPRIERYMRSRDEDVKLAALQVLYLYRDELEPWMPTMLEAWDDESYGIRLELLGLWERMERKAAPAGEILLRAMHDDDERISSRAMNLLGLAQVDPARVLPKLRDALDDLGDDPAAIAIGCYGAQAVPYLRSALESPDDDVRYFALAGVYRMGPSSARLKGLVRPLVEIDDDEIAHRASMAMGAMGEEAAEALPAIWARFAGGKMKTHQIAEILARVGEPGRRFLVARAAEPKQHKYALAALRNWPGDTGFAASIVDPMLRAEDARQRAEALVIVGRSLTPPPRDPNDRRWDHEYVPAPALIESVRARVTPHAKDADGNVRLQATTVLGWIDDIERTRDEQQER